MKNLLKYSTLGILAAITFGSCLKTNKFYEGFENIKPIADIPLSELSNGTDSLSHYWVDIANSPTATIDTAIAVHLSSKNHVGDVTFKMALADNDPTFLAMFNHNKRMFYYYNTTSQATWDSLTADEQAAVLKYVDDDGHKELTIMPDSLYSVGNWNPVIKNAGVLSVGKMPIKFRTGAVDASGNNVFASNVFVLPIKIEDAGGYKIASNFKEIFLVVGAKNKYDGKYHYTTSANTSLVPNADKNVTLLTLGLNSLTFGLLGTYSNEVDYFIDPVTNQILVTCPSLGVQVPQDTRSKYDPATKTLHVYWKQGNGGRTFEETFVYQGPR